MLRLKSEELITLLYHLSIMRKPFKKGIKKKHSKQEVKEFVSTYQSVLDKLEQVDQDLELHEIQLENEEVELLRTFLPWYIGELEKELGEEQHQGLDILKTINHMLLIPA
ncbi:MAG TPA: hypothetical protein GX525_11910 [Bacilli bacterium]|nr:hypothetical protein [Bacilli bacterium]